MPIEKLQTSDSNSNSIAANVQQDTYIAHFSQSEYQNKTRIFYKTNTIANEKSRFLGCSMKSKERRTTRRMNARNQTPNPRIKP